MILALWIDNYGIFNDQNVIDFNNKFTLIYGQNCSGKSTIINAIKEIKKHILKSEGMWACDYEQFMSNNHGSRIDLVFRIDGQQDDEYYQYTLYKGDIFDDGQTKTGTLRYQKDGKESTFNIIPQEVLDYFITSVMPEADYDMNKDDIIKYLNKFGMVHIKDFDFDKMTVTRKFNKTEQAVSFGYEGDSLFDMIELIQILFSNKDDNHYQFHVLDGTFNSLHPRVMRAVLKELETRNSHALITTNDVSFLRWSKDYKPEQIYFTQVTNYLYSIIHSLGEFKDLDDYPDREKAYLNGNFGGVPYISSI